MKTVRMRIIYFNDIKNVSEAFINMKCHFNFVGCEFEFYVCVKVSPSRKFYL